jgi:hypothetical protein
MKTFKLWDYIDVQEFADFARISYNRALAFVQADQRCEYYYYSKQEILEEISKMKAELSSDVGYSVQETFAGKVARETGLTLVGEASVIYTHGW